MSVSASGAVHHPTRMVGRLKRSLKKEKSSKRIKDHRDLLAVILGHKDWNDWLDGNKRDPKFICHEVTFEEARDRLKEQLMTTGIMEGPAVRAAHRTFSFEPAQDPRQVDLFDLLAEMHVSEV